MSLRFIVKISNVHVHAVAKNTSNTGHDADSAIIRGIVTNKS